MSFRFALCMRCGLHGRFVDERKKVLVEVASKEAAHLALGALAYGHDAALASGIVTSVIAQSKMPNDEAFVDPVLREQVAIWNLAAAATNAPRQFGKTDFHDYVRLLGSQTAPGGNPQPN